LPVVQWKKRDIENYLCYPRVPEEYAARLAAERSYGPLGGGACTACCPA
jgi:hypothetical protein